MDSKLFARPSNLVQIVTVCEFLGIDSPIFCGYFLLNGPLSQIMENFTGIDVNYNRMMMGMNLQVHVIKCRGVGAILSKAESDLLFQ